MTENFEDRLNWHEDMLRRLTQMVVQMDGYMKNQEGINERLTAAIERIDATQGDIRTTLARVETLLARLPRGETNGRDA